MLSINTLPSRIDQSLNEFNKQKEKPDVYPSAFLVDNKKYYYFTFNPSAEKLIIDEDGQIKSLEEIKYVALLANSYYVGLLSILNGRKWVKAKTKKNYMKLEKILLNIKDELTNASNDESILQSIDQFIYTARTIISLQIEIEQAVKNGIEKVQSTNKSGIVTKEDFNELRSLTLKMVRAAHQQNTIQIETEEDRQKIFDFLSNQSFLKDPKLAFYNLQLSPFKKFMISSESSIGKEVLDMDYVWSEDVPLEEHPNVGEVLAQYKNPRT
ncbi:hypothetical protein IHV12_22035 [Fictibacillus sp. 7GRE50]|uniref:hypothetical protein n=1 Tax=unclassified Fictibacillus TaxID=2644029 RepID=UPI0018CE7FF4|nr:MULTISPECIES: hypothetical protein [unclassified Fictibacillus]MBH0167592.1 hypothetical protein [Fictibacillus sp. 7GRE50]MBH0176153.1 hypothetical protein [Fictibacillus sp. 23RED33]